MNIETDDTDQDDSGDATEGQKIEMTGVESMNKEKVDKITGIESTNVDNESTKV